jgi:hypothetical protein
MNEYMQKAPMYQQIQDLQGKLRGFQQPQPQQGQMSQPAEPTRMAMDMPPGRENVAQDFEGGFGRSRGGYGGGRGQQPDIGIGDFMRRQLPGYGGGRGGYGQQMPQQDYGYGQMQNKMRQQAAFGQQQRQQYGGLDALQQYLQPPSYRPPVVAPLPLNPGLTNPKPALPPPPPSAPVYDPGGPSNGTF